MPEMPRDRPHLYLRGSGKSERYKRKPGSGKPPLPQRDRATHAEKLRVAIGEALAAAKLRNAERDPFFVSDLGGFYLDFEFPAGSAYAAELLENRPKQIELVAFRQDTQMALAIATVFVPNAAEDHFSKKVEAYRSQDVEPRKGTDGSAAPADDPRRGRPKNEELVARIEREDFAIVWCSTHSPSPQVAVATVISCESPRNFNLGFSASKKPK